MVLSASLRAIRDCKYYRRWRTANVDGCVEAHQTNAMVQIRSMIDFLNCGGIIQADTMIAVQFFGCSKQSIPFPDSDRKAANKYAAHKSWDAVAKDAAAGARQLSKREVVSLGLKALDGFLKFWDECKGTSLTMTRNPNADRYVEILRANLEYLKTKGV
jgi:hypothetical protein